MQIPVLIESVSGNGFRATGGVPLALSAEGTTRDEAIARLKSLIADRLAVGAELISVGKDPAKLARVYQRLAENVAYLGRWPTLPFTEAAIDRSARCGP